MVCPFLELECDKLVVYLSFYPNSVMLKQFSYATTNNNEIHKITPSPLKPTETLTSAAVSNTKSLFLIKFTFPNRSVSRIISNVSECIIAHTKSGVNTYRDLGDTHVHWRVWCWWWTRWKRSNCWAVSRPDLLWRRRCARPTPLQRTQHLSDLLI